MPIFNVIGPHQGEELGLLSDIDSIPYGSTSHGESEFVSSNPLSSDEPEGLEEQIKPGNESDGGKFGVQDQHTQQSGRGIA